MNGSIASQLSNLDLFRELVLKSYIKANEALYTRLTDEYDAADKRSKEIRQQAAKQGTQWEEVSNIFASSGESVGNWGLSAGGFVRKRWSLRQVGIE